MSWLPGFTKRDWTIIVAVGVITPLIDDRIEHGLVQFFADIRNSVNIFDYTGGPLNSDLILVWLEYGAILTAYLVRKPGAATIAMTINGFLQVLVDGTHAPHHFLYGITGLGADVTFAIYRFERYDFRTCALAGAASQAFWIPVTYAYHAVLYLYPISFVAGDLVIRILGSAVGDGLLGAALGYLILRTFHMLPQKRVSLDYANESKTAILPNKVLVTERLNSVRS
ncbi:MAG: ECF transporter S component [Thaumarchaeota archaeon]|nr:ECF transporter S component [Nitrososphaerota archaeon]